MLSREPSTTWRPGNPDPDRKRAGDLYRVDSESVAHAVREWAIANGDNPLLRIALCGYKGEHAMPGSWEVLAWKTAGGYSSQGRKADVNRHKERVWFSPACVREQAPAADLLEAVA